MDHNPSETLSSRSHSLHSTSKNGSSRTVPDADIEIDFTKDNSLSPLDIECHIQAERITKILDEAITKTKMALCLPSLVKYNVLSSELSPQHLDELILIFDQYDNPLTSVPSWHSNQNAMEEIKGGDVSLHNRINPELGHLLSIVNSYPKLRPIVDEMIAERKDTYKTTQQYAKGSDTSLEYLMALEIFRDLMVKQMAMTAAEEFTIKLRTKKLEVSNAKLMQKIQEQAKRLKAEQEQFDDLMIKKVETINKLEKELESLKVDSNIRLKKTILDSDRQMVLATRAHVVKNEILKDEERESKDLYEATLSKHLTDEKIRRLRRCKVQTQLLSWVQKYDSEMGEKQAELDSLDKKYEDEVQKCQELEKKLAEQDKEFIPLMEEKEAEYQQQLLEKMYKFQMEHSVKVIQRAWREVLENRAEKKRLKKMINQQAAVKLAQQKQEAKNATKPKKKADGD